MRKLFKSLYHEVMLSTIKRRYRLDLSLELVQLGSAYGRYNMPKLSDEIDLLSIGVGNDVSFEVDLQANYNLRKLVLVDPDERNKKFAQNSLIGFSWMTGAVSDSRGEKEFFLPLNENHVSGSLIHEGHLDRTNIRIVECYRLSDITKMFFDKVPTIIKLDIEGSEYAVLTEFFKTTSDCHLPQILLIEFHDRWGNNSKSIKIFKILRGKGYKLFYQHNIMETGWIKI